MHNRANPNYYSQQFPSDIISEYAKVDKPPRFCEVSVPPLRSKDFLSERLGGPRYYEEEDYTKQYCKYEQNQLFHRKKGLLSHQLQVRLKMGAFFALPKRQQSTPKLRQFKTERSNASNRSVLSTVSLHMLHEKNCIRRQFRQLVLSHAQPPQPTPVLAPKLLRKVVGRRWRELKLEPRELGDTYLPLPTLFDGRSEK